MKKVALFNIAHDGISTYYTGVGTIVRGQSFSLNTIAKKLRDNYSVLLSCFAITPFYQPDCLGYSSKLLASSKKLYEETGGGMYFCLNNSDGKERYGDQNNWPTASASAATIIFSILNKFDKVIIMAHDTPFSQVSTMISKQIPHANISCAWIPHSTGLIHERGRVNPKRLEWEYDSIKAINSSKNTYIGYIGEFMKKHLIEYYGANSEKMIPFEIGLHNELVKFYKETEIERQLKKHKIPKNKPLIISVGRADYIKGFDIFLKVAMKIPDAHFVIQTFSYYPNDPIIKELNKLAGKNVTINWELDLEFPKMLMQWKNTKVQVCLSRGEPTGVTVPEARYYQKAILVVSSVDGLKDQIKNGENGFVVNTNNLNQVVETIKRAIHLDPQEEKKIICNSKKLVEEEYNIEQNTMLGIEMLLSKTK